jgi:hypothetical protein
VELVAQAIERPPDAAIDELVVEDDDDAAD